MQRRVHWKPREPPLSPHAAVAEGGTARELASSLLDHPDRLASVQLLASSDILCVRGEPQHLPWVPGVIYLAPCPSGEPLWMPTYLQPDLDPSWVIAALGEETGQARPYAVVPAWGRVFSLALARPTTLEQLRAWMEAKP